MMHAQDSPDSLFSFNISDFMTEEDVSSSSTQIEQDLLTSSSDLKGHFKSEKNLLSQDLRDLIQDAQSIRDVLNLIRYHLPQDLESVIILVSFIERHQSCVLQAKKHLDDQRSQDTLQLKMDQDKQATSSLKRQIDVHAPAQIDAEIASLEVKE